MDELDVLRRTTASAVIRGLKAQLVRHGIPDVMVTDNGPQFSSEMFRDFDKEWSFKHETSSPGYPQSNGEAENAVKTAKKLIESAIRAGTDKWLALLDYRRTPSEFLESSPAQRLFSRRRKNPFATKRHLLQPAVVTGITNRMAMAKAKQARGYNKSAHDLADLNKGDPVRVQPLRR